MICLGLASGLINSTSWAFIQSLGKQRSISNWSYSLHWYSMVAYKPLSNPSQAKRILRLWLRCWYLINEGVLTGHRDCQKMSFCIFQPSVNLENEKNNRAYASSNSLILLLQLQLFFTIRKSYSVIISVWWIYVNAFGCPLLKEKQRNAV